MKTIYYAADSTVQFNNYSTFPQTGIGQVLPKFLAYDVRVENHAKNGRSTKSFLEEGRFDVIKNEIKAGDFLFIQFGHNDEKKEDAARYTDPNTDFKANLLCMINAAKEKGATPVIITAVARRNFAEDGSVDNKEHEPHANAARELCAQEGVALVDLLKMSNEKLAEIGPEKSKDWYMHLPENVYPYHMEGLADDTHLKYEGAINYAKLIAQGLYNLGGVYRDLIIKELFEGEWKLIDGRQ